ncbi:response regulator [Haladaptatus sp. CMSO5]|uniref:response regulator n=1 Tax=Haladaptatus sp. CMSO5 TaxID=3120514 RepID=UPI002FCE66B1
MATSARPTVLIVEDEPDVGETYERWLAESYTVIHAASGKEALSKLDDSIDIVLLDRMMPGMSGDEVLEEIRARDIDCRVAIVTAVDPDFDIIEMGFDEYVTKPPTRDQLRDTIERLLARGAVADDLQNYFSLVARKAALEAEFTRSVLESNEEYRDLVARIERGRENLDTSFDGLSSDADFVGVLRAIVEDDST